MEDLKRRGLWPRTKLDEISFVITSYRSDGDVPVARLPEFCPYLDLDLGEPCRVGFHHLRPRKTGSVRGIVVCECTTHGKAFGLYPPGAVPYGRVSWIPVGPGGEALRVEEDEPPATASRKLSAKLTAFVPTYLGAAVDEGRGVLWSTGASWEELPGNTGPRRVTQVRRSLRTLRVLGIAGGPDGGSAGDVADRVHLSEVLGVPLAELRALGETILEGGTPGAPQARGLAVCEVLEALPEVRPRCLAHRLAMAGYLAGVWGLCWDFDATRGTLTTEPFRRGGRVVMAM